MRVLLDTSVLISYLRSTTPGASATFALLSAAIDRAITLLAVEGVFEELLRNIDQRPDLAARIARSDVADLIAELRSIGVPVDRLPEPYVEIGRDEDDYFLVAHAVAAGADYIVTWDKDLLDLDPIDDLRVATPPQLLTALRTAGIL